MSLRNRAAVGERLAKSVLVVGQRMKRGACECVIYKEQSVAGAGAGRVSPTGEDAAALDQLSSQRANIAYVAPGQALLVSPSDLILRTPPVGTSVSVSGALTASSSKGAIVMNKAQTVRRGKFLRTAPLSQYCPHRYVCPRCPWQHLDPLSSHKLKHATAMQLVGMSVRSAVGDSAQSKSSGSPRSSSARGGSLNETNNINDNIVGAALGTAAPSSSPVADGILEALEWLDPLPFPTGALRCRTATLYFGANVNGSSTLGVPVSDFFSSTRGDEKSSDEPHIGSGGAVTVEGVSETCLVLTPTMREVAYRVERLWASDKGYRRKDGGSALRSITFVESATSRSMLVRVVVSGVDARTNALRHYTDPSAVLSPLEGRLVDAILKGCVTSDGGIQIEVMVTGDDASSLQPGGAALNSNRGGSQDIVSDDVEALMYRQLYPTPLVSRLPPSSPTRQPTVSGSTGTSSLLQDIVSITVPTARDGSSDATFKVRLPLQVVGAGVGMFRYTGGVEAVVAASIALASQATSVGDISRPCTTLVDYPEDSLSIATLAAAKRSGLWEVAQTDGGNDCTGTKGRGILSAATFEALGEGHAGEWDGRHACMVTRLYGGTSYRAKRAMAALSAKAHFFARCVAVCEDDSALRALMAWLHKKGALDGTRDVVLAVVDVDPMSHHFATVVSWNSFTRKPSSSGRSVSKGRLPHAASTPHAVFTDHPKSRGPGSGHGNGGDTTRGEARPNAFKGRSGDVRRTSAKEDRGNDGHVAPRGTGRDDAKAVFSKRK